MNAHLHVVLRILDGRLQLHGLGRHALGAALDLRGDLHGLLVQATLVQRLRVVQPVLVVVGTEQGELLVAVGGVDVVLDVVVAVGEEGEGGA